jgi:hypothetical protein
VILSASIHRTESYTAPDTLYLSASEATVLSGTKVLQVGYCSNGAETCADSLRSWHTVPIEYTERLSDGSYRFLVETGDSGSIKPGYELRFFSGVADTLGNRVDTSDLHWSATVAGTGRPALVTVAVSSTVPRIDAHERDRNGPGGFVLQATNGSSNTLQWWDPQTGYLSDNDPKVTSVCADAAYCNGPTVEINYPVRMIIYIYDHMGTYAISKTVDITQQDLDALKKDKLDRVEMSIRWNHRTAEGKVVASGIYHWRILSYVQISGLALPVMTNNLYSLGVKVAK